MHAFGLLAHGQLTAQAVAKEADQGLQVVMDERGFHAEPLKVGLPPWNVGFPEEAPNPRFLCRAADGSSHDDVLNGMGAAALPLLGISPISPGSPQREDAGGKRGPVLAVPGQWCWKKAAGPDIPATLVRLWESHSVQSTIFICDHGRRLAIEPGRLDTSTIKS
jgi:hypothetical protein